MNTDLFAIGGFVCLGGFLLFVISMMILDEVWGFWETFFSAAACLGLGVLVLSILTMAGYLGYYTF